MELPEVQSSIVINNPEGLHARPAHRLARVALKYESTIELIHDNHHVDAKSILHLLTLGAVQGTELTILARGSDAEQAVQELTELFESNFKDDEETISRQSSEDTRRL